MHSQKMTCSDLEDVPCPLCQSKEADHVLTGRDLINSMPGRFNVIRCKSCNLMRTNPRPTKTGIADYYPDHYGPYNNTKIKENPTTSHQYKRFRAGIKNFLFNSRTTYIPRCKPGRLLEIGCASGSFLHEMALSGWSVQGIEFSKKAAQEVEKMGYPVFNGSLERAPQPASPFDMIVGWMVFEHLHNPVSDLAKLRAWSTPDTWLVISVPNASDLQLELFGDSWHDLHLPNHLFHFTPKTLGNVLSASGWKIHSIHHQRTVNNLIVSLGNLMISKGYRTFGSSLIKLPGRLGKLRYLLHPVGWILSKFGQTGRMTVWAKINE